MKKYFLPYFLLILFFPFTVSGQAVIKTGEIFGTVVNPSLDSMKVADQKVTLYQLINNQEVQNEHPVTYTDSGGRFAFKDIEINERFTYYPLVLYNGLEYTGKLVKPTPPVPRTESDIRVFESTSSDSAISIVGHHIIIEPGAKDLVVSEIFVFVNRDNYTYVGTKPAANGKNIVLQMEIPEEARDLKFGGDLMNCCVIVNKNEIFDTMGLIPGMRRVALEYALPYSETTVDISKTIAFPTESLDIFVEDPILLGSASVKSGTGGNAQVSENVLSEAKPFQMRGGQYTHYQAKKLSKKDTFTFTITNLPRSKRDFKWLPPVLLFIVITGGYFVNKKQKKTSARPA